LYGGLTKGLILQGLLRDQAPNTMNHSAFPPSYWMYGSWTDEPTKGSCGTANGGSGWSGTDFELPIYLYSSIRTPNAPGGVIGNGETGLVGDACNITNAYTNCGTLGADRTPVYRYPGASPLGTVGSPSSFYNWFHSSQQTIAIPYNITLASVGGRFYQYSSISFFPLDNKGWRDNNLGNTGAPHNFAFCFEAHAQFTYQGGEIFTFLGNDDVWLYINNLLVIDLGGIHTAQSASVAVDSIRGITPGNSYKFDFFYCQRHTTGSTFEITTSIAFYCSYVDACGVCEGDGQSCCTASKLASCNDKNACTTDACGVLTDCTNTPIVCNDNNSCTVDSCSPTTGCVYTFLNCNDNNPCTVDICSPTTGCGHIPVVCSPSDICHSVSCSPTSGACVSTPVVCNDNNPCTTDTCVANVGCVFTANTC